MTKAATPLDGLSPRYGARVRSTTAALLEISRPEQWVKNLLVFVPLLLAPGVVDGRRAVLAAWAFVALSLCASGGYALNDVIDARADRGHPRKRLRPLASGSLSVTAGLAAGCTLLASGLAAGWLLLPSSCAALLLLYVSLTAAYSLGLKRVRVVDVLLLVVLYALRLFTGGAASGDAVPDWFLMFAGPLFLSLALLKRYAELRRCAEQGAVRAQGIGYAVIDRERLRAIGVVIGLFAGLLLGLGGDRPEAPRWLLGSLMAGWVIRLWFVAGNGRMNDGPLSFIVRDPVSYAAVALATIAVAGATR